LADEQKSKINAAKLKQFYHPNILTKGYNIPNFDNIILILRKNESI